MSKNIYEHSEADEIASNMNVYPVTFDEALAIVRTRMPNESETILSNVAEALLARVPLQDRQLACARRLPNEDIQRHAAIATDNGPLDPADNSFTTACELVRQERNLPKLHHD